MTTLEITNDETFDECDVDNPRDFDNNGTMLCVHRRYMLGDNNAFQELCEAIRSSKKYRTSWEEKYDLSNPVDIIEVAQKADVFVCLIPIYMYEHGAIAISHTPFSCPWDSGQLGYIFMTKSRARSEHGVYRVTQQFKAQVESWLISEIQEYDSFLRS